MSETMLERVARAIAAADDEDYMEDQRRYDRRARAAIEAMREPTEAMVQAAIKAGSVENGVFAIQPYHIEGVWEPMLDAALNEDQPSD